MSDIKALEFPTLKVPYEFLNKKFRFSQRVLEREVCAIQKNTTRFMQNFNMSLSAETKARLGSLYGTELDELKGTRSVTTTSSLAGDENGCDDEMGEETTGAVTMAATTTTTMTTTAVSLTDFEKQQLENMQTDVANGNSTDEMLLEQQQKQQQQLEAQQHLFSMNCQFAVPSFLDTMAERLRALKRKADETIHDEVETITMNKKRVHHLRELAKCPSAMPYSLAPVAQWKNKRLNRMIVDYMLRAGYVNSATKLTEQCNLQGLTNVELFEASREIETSLQNQSTTKCLRWCAENRAKLKRQNSKMEFNLRVQDYIELVRDNKRLEAVEYARKHLAPLEEEHADLIQQCMALLAFPIDTLVDPYRKLMNKNRWKKLVKEFRKENFRLYQLYDQSVFTVALEAGLSVLKTPACYSTDPIHKNTNCPVCQPGYNKLAQSLPKQHCSHSRLICNMSGEPLNEHNHPMMLPNGQIYGTRALQEMAALNDGFVTCPRTKEVFHFKKCEKIYVM